MVIGGRLVTGHEWGHLEGRGACARVEVPQSLLCAALRDTRLLPAECCEPTIVTASAFD